MSVFNGAAALERTLDSIAAQSMRDYELIVVDDGSTDATPAMLARRVAADPRMRVITQPNAGLTRALIRGCAEARGEFIARHDCGDVSMPERFAKQLAAFHDETVLVSCTTTHRAPGGEWLYDSRGDGDEVRASLLRGDLKRIHGIPHHGSAMFRRRAYTAAGGYREEFRFAQDLDLWIRLAALGTIEVVDEALYTAAFEPNAISGARRAEQVRLTEIAVRLRDAANDTERDGLLRDAARVSGTRGASKRKDAPALYFIASCLRRNHDAAWKNYARAALHANPLHVRSWALLARAAFQRRP
jgi:glycosyltransferase involved in cell wall biosynthesis